MSRRTRQCGVAAVEFAVLVPILVVLLSAPLLIGRVLWHYTVIQKAAHDATRYLSMVPEAEMRSQDMASKAADVARVIAEAELTDLNTGASAPIVTIKCNGNTCGGVTPWSNVSVYIETEMRDPLFNSRYSGPDGIPIHADVKMNYIGTK
jgi:Flp pilus assembly protein TadG